MRLNDSTICAQKSRGIASSNTWMQVSRLSVPRGAAVALVSVCIVPVLQYRLQRGQDRFQMPPIAPPAIDAFAIHRFGHLGVARRRNVALLFRVLMEQEHRRGVVDADEIADFLCGTREIG